MAIRRQNLWLTLLMLLSPTVVMMASGDSLSVACPLVRVQADTLPGLHIPRAGHQVFCANGDYVVAGGHTHGFVPTPTVEYFRDGQWHLLQMVYNHDAGFSVKLASGKVLLGGGTSEPIVRWPPGWNWMADRWSSPATGITTTASRCSMVRSVSRMLRMQASDVSCR